MPDSPPAALDLAAVVAALGDAARRFDIDAVAACDSTNSRLLASAALGAVSGTVLVADAQNAGRGRLGRRWASAPGDSLTFSLLWRFPPDSGAPAALSLAVGLALALGLEQLGVAGVALKWPNDLLYRERKLAGVLVELQPGDIRAAVIGIGLNLRLPRNLPAGVEAAALDEALAGITREAVLAALLQSLCVTLDRYRAGGFAALRAAWQSRHAWAGRPVRISGGAELCGRCVGVDDDGALRLATDSGMQRVVAGDVSLRPVA